MKATDKPKTHRAHAQTDSAEETERLGEKLGKGLRGGEVIELVGDVGGGKTTFVRGLARGAGSPDAVASPTFTISRLYTTDAFAIHHFDFYRLHEPGIMADELAEISSDEGDVTIVEWADIVQHVLPEKRLTVTIRHRPDGGREYTLTAPEPLRYLIQAVAS